MDEEDVLGDKSREEDPQVVANRKSREALEVGQRIFELSHATGARAAELKALLLAEVEKHSACGPRCFSRA